MRNPIQVTTKLVVSSRSEWRLWLASNHDTETEIWLVSDDRRQKRVEYLDAVEEALCFGWIDGISKRISESELAQRFTPRKPRSNWTELNKARAQRLIDSGQMTDAGLRKLPDITTSYEIADDILIAIAADADIKNNFEKFPDLYVRVRIGYIEEMRRKPEEFTRRLNNFLRKTAQGKMYGNWNDGGRLS